MSAKTTASDFGIISVLDNAPLFRVNPGIPGEYALSKAACLAESIGTIATQGVQSGIDESTAYLIEFAAEAIQALCQAGGAP